jgi:hypothetical protein
MSLPILILGIAVFLLGAAAGAFTVLVIGIHMSCGDQLSNAPRRYAGAATHRFLTGVRNSTGDQDEED